jgi:hypothetical protein
MPLKDVIKALGIEREYRRFLRMWGADGDGWDEIAVKLKEAAEVDAAAGLYNRDTDTITLYLNNIRKSRELAAITVIHELAHRAVELFFGNGRYSRYRGDLAYDECLPREWKWWATREELIAELTAVVAAADGPVETGAMRELAQKILDPLTPKWSVTELWRHARPGAGPRAVGVTRRGLVLE